jgi:gamma-glutamylputrescine oxidase
MAEPVRSYYLAQAPADLSRAALNESLRCDVAIVGGGIAGCSAALYLARRGYRVVVLEADSVGAGASGRSGGQFLPGFACGQAVLERALGAEAANRLFAQSRMAHGLVDRLLREEAIDIERVPGTLQVAVKPGQARALREEQRLLERLGYEGLEYVEPPRLAQLVASNRYCAGLYDRQAFHGNPLLYVRGLARAAERAGATIYERTRVDQLAPDGGIALRTPSGTVHASHALLACNAQVAPLARTLGRRLLPVGTFIVATAPLGAARCAALLPSDAAVADCNHVLDYFRRSRDHRLLFGGRAGVPGFDEQVLSRRTRERMVAVFPDLAGVAIEFAWGGLVDLTLNRAPDFGRLNPSLYYVQGFSGHGLVLATLAGTLAGEAIAGQSERFDAFTRIPHRTVPGGPGTAHALLAIALLWNRLLDALP